MKKNAINNNPFEIESINTETSSTRKLDLTPQLISISNQRALEIIRFVGANSDIHDLANRVKNEGQASDLFELIGRCVEQNVIESDSKFLEGAEDSILDRLLESRRSDRSKSKSKGLSKNMSALVTFISSGYAEMLVRLVWNKPYQVSTTDYSNDDLANDQDALNKKIRSLQSKQSRLSKTAPFIPADQKSLDAVQTEIERLKDLRVGTTVTGKTVIKSADVDSIREALKLVNVEGLGADDQVKLLELMKKLG